ncbi:MAG: TonB-dependent receptor plug domain-containing protein, partial [Pseudomonadota bacterium]
MKCSYLALCGALTFAFPVSIVPACAEEAPAGESPVSILVVGQRDAPIEIEPRGLAVSLGQDQFAAINAFNTEDLMKYAPNFFVRKRYSGDSNGVPGFRGTHSTQSARTLVMVDGFVVSNFLGNSFGFAPKWGVVGPGEVEQFDIVYGPYSSRYVGNSMGGIINITTRDPRETEAFATVQGMVQPYDAFSKDGPWSLRLTGRFFRNTGQPMTFLGLIPVAGAGGTVVTGAIVDTEHVRATAAGTGIPGAPGNASTPYFAAQSPAKITQEQAKLKVGYDDGSLTGQFLLAYWHNEDSQTAPDCYLRDAAGTFVCEGRVRIGAQSYTASGATFSKTVRDEVLAGLKLAAPLAGNTTARLAVSTYQIAKSDGFTSNGYATGVSGGAGTLARQNPTGWWTADVQVENKGGTVLVAA